MARLTNKVALVIGGASGIGLAVGRRFAQEGAETFLTGRREDQLDQAVSRIAGAAHGIRADAGDRADLERAIDTVRTHAGRIDVVVVNAGASEAGMIGEITEEHFDHQINLNVRSLVFAVQSALPSMGTGGSIVLIGSIADQIGTPGYGVYGATKAAVRSLARTWTNELAPRGIRVNVVSPGPVDTAMFASVSDEMKDALAQEIPLGRLGHPDEVASAVLFLASDESSFVAGAELCVDGGLAQV